MFKNRLIVKVLIALSVIIVAIVTIFSYIFWQNDQNILNEIRTYSRNSAIEAINQNEKYKLSEDRKKNKTNIEIIGRHSSEHIKNLDIEGLREMLYLDMQANNVVLIQIIDNDMDEPFLTAVKKDKKIIFVQKIPNELKEMKKLHKIEEFKANIIDRGSHDTHRIHSEKNMSIEQTILAHNKHDGKIIGQAILYYDNSIFEEKVSMLKNDAIKKIDKFDEKIDEKIDTFMMNKFFLYFIGLFAILITMTIILKALVNTPLQKLKAGLDDFFLVLHDKKKNPSKIQISSKDEFEDMAHSVNKNIATSVNLHKTLSILNAVLETKSKKEKTLLDNSGQGFLTFDEDFLVDNTYSKKCVQLLGSNIGDKDISNLLSLDAKDTSSFKSFVLGALKVDNKIIQKSMLSLLPSEITIRDKDLQLEYKIVEGNKTMLIITNVTQQNILREKLEIEQNTAKMMMTIIENSASFHDIKRDFAYFIEHRSHYISTSRTSMKNMSNLYREIHTFKGVFSQFFMNDIASELHDIESQISNFIKDGKNITNDQILSFINDIDFDNIINDEYNTISKLLGEEFACGDNVLIIDADSLKSIEDRYVSLLESCNINNELSNNILNDIKKHTQRKLKSQLKSYIGLAKRVSQDLEKEIYDFEIVGDENVIITDKLVPFVKSLVHVFRNSVDHGIETPEKRLELDKDEIGSISCSFNSSDDGLQIVISDDGAGIDIEKIKMKISKEVDVSSLDDGDIYQYIFEDDLSTKDEISELSGRGIGMGAVKQVVDSLNGTIEIQSKINIGTTFIFNLPINQEEG